MDYDLQRLGPREFEHLVQALAVKLLGTTVRIYGDGPDGGREFVMEGTANRIFDDAGIPWEGKIVGQAKFRARLGDVSDNSKWLNLAIQAELERWKNKREKSQRPQYIIFATNVPISATVGGGVDRVHAIVQRYARSLELKACQIWHYDHLCRLLDDAPDIRRSFAGLITPGDVLSRLRDYFDEAASQAGDILTDHAAKDLIKDQWVRLGQAGDPGNERLSLGSTAVDLPARWQKAQGGPDVACAAELLRLGGMAGKAGEPKQRGFVLLGGPGQGKTTIGQLLCQVYRIGFLAESQTAGSEPQVIADDLAQRLRAEGLEIPPLRRWPFRIDLSAYSDDLARGENASVLAYIASRVYDVSGVPIGVPVIRRWLESWPWFLVLDGFDEVPTPQLREMLVGRISDLLVDAERLRANIVILATTRPQGYVGEFSAERYDHLYLRPLRPPEAVAYAEKLLSVRFRADPESVNQISARVARASQERTTARLLQSPLQVTIMSLLLERMQRAPQQRYSLFNAYYETIYSREVAKRGATSSLLEANRGHVTALHEHVGLLLQAHAEREGEADSALDHSQLRELAFKRLTAEGYDSHDASELAEKLIRASTHRLVLLVPRGMDGISFEVRSLQEFMAARAITTGGDDAVLKRMVAAAPSAFWRNTWLLAAGRIFLEREHLRRSVVAMLRELDLQDELTLQIGPGSGLAAQMLDDEIVTAMPQFERLLLQHAAEFLRFIPTAQLGSYSDTLLRLALRDTTNRSVVESVLDKAAKGEMPGRLNAFAVYRHWASVGEVGGITSRARQRATAISGSIDSLHIALIDSSTRSDRSNVAAKADGNLGELLFGRTRDSSLRELRKLFTQTRYVRRTSAKGSVVSVTLVTMPAVSDLERLLNVPGVLESLTTAMGKLGDNEWMALEVIRTMMAHWYEGRPVGQQVLDVRFEEV